MLTSAHLEFARQSYMEHFHESMYYCWLSLKSSFFFACHAVIPDIFQKNGSETINYVHCAIQHKYKCLS